MNAYIADLAPLYENLCQELGWTPDATQLKRMQTANQEKLQQLKVTTKDADENLGETEVKEALTAEADYLNRIGQLKHRHFPALHQQCRHQRSHFGTLGWD